VPKYDLKVIESMRKDFCEFCGSPAHGWPHHIKTRGAGGKEKPYNLIQLCGECHRKVHDGKIRRRQLIEIAAKREGMSEKEIYDLLGWLIEDKAPKDVLIERSVLAGKTLEDAIELYISCVERGEDSMWDRAAIVTALYETGLTPRQIASSLGCSASLCRKFVRTFNAFPDPEKRIPFLSFRHHVIAAYTDDPEKWINLAADNHWSTREMQEHVNIQDKDDLAYSRAEKALRYVEKVLSEKTEAACRLLDELEELLSKQKRGSISTEHLFGKEEEGRLSA